MAELRDCKIEIVISGAGENCCGRLGRFRQAMLSHGTDHIISTPGPSPLFSDGLQQFAHSRPSITRALLPLSEMNLRMNLTKQKVLGLLCNSVKT